MQDQRKRVILLIAHCSASSSSPHAVPFPSSPKNEALMRSGSRNRIVFFALSAVFLCSAALTTHSQYKEWRPVAPEDIASKTPIVDKDADAEALFWEMRIDDSSMNDLDMWHYVRVKIFTERGREKFSKFDIPFVKGKKIRNLAARVIRADGSIVEILEKDIFEREIVRVSGAKMKAKSFAVPNIEPGVIVEYKYKEAIDDAGASGMRLPLQRDIPVRSLNYYYKPNGKNEPKYQAYNLSGFKFEKDDKGFWLAKRTNVPSFKEEPLMPPEDMVKPWLLLTSARVGFISGSSFSYTFVIKDPSNVSGYWGAFARERGSLATLIIKADKKIKATAEMVTAGATNQDEKLRKLYAWVQKEIKNVPYDPNLTPEQREKLTAPKSIPEVLEKRTANSSSYVDWLFAAMASSLGMDVRLAYMGNRNNMFFNPSMTNDQLVHLAAIAVRDGESFKYLNPGDPFMPYGMLSWHDEGSAALLVAPDTYQWVESTSYSHTDNRLDRIATLKLSEDGTLEGEVIIERNGQQALTYRQTYWDETAEKRAEAVTDAIKARISTAEVSSVTVENVFDHSKPVIERYKVRIPNYAQKTGRRLFLQPSFFSYGLPPVFSSGSRQYDIFFRHAWSEKDKVSIEVPKGFELDNADAPTPYSDAGKISSHSSIIKYDKSSRLLMLDRNFYFGANGNLLFRSKSYAPLKNVFDEFHKIDAHTISLRQNQ
jgi:Transglutaminase-like superfamily.